MSEVENIEVIQRLFDAVGRGDMSSVTAMLAEDISMQSPVTKADHKGLTWCRPRRGPAETLSFFKELSDSAILEPFENLEFTAQGDKVVVEGSNRGTARSTGKCYEHEWVMVFTLHGGKVVGMRHYYDTADIEPAFIKNNPE